MKLALLLLNFALDQNYFKNHSIKNSFGVWDNYFTFSISVFLTSLSYIYSIGFTPLKLDDKAGFSP